MANPSKAKGTSAETAVVRWFQSRGYQSARRIVMEGSQTTADVYVSPWLRCQVKAYAALPSDAVIDMWLEECDEQALHHGAPVWLIVKRPGKSSPEHWHLYARHHGCTIQMRLGEAVRAYGDGRLLVA